MFPSRRKRKPRHSVEAPTMLSKPELQVAGQPPATSPVLFLTVDGEPMRFFLCPGPAKVELQPLIKAGGGLVCRAQEPGAILLVDPKDTGAVTESTAHWYVSVQYVRDCVEKNEQLELEDYRLKENPPLTKKRAAKTNGTGRSPYTAEEDAAIMDYVATRADRLKGNVMWQEMERQHVTGHSWQSMKYRCMNKLWDRAAPGPGEGRRRTGEPKTAERQEPPRAAGSSPEHTAASSSEDLTSSDLAQPDHQQADDPPIDVGGPDNPASEEEEEQASDAPPQHTSSPAKSLKEEKLTPKPVRAPVVTSSPTVSQRRAIRRRLLPDMPPPADTPSRKRARAASPHSSPTASTSARLPWSRLSPPPSPAPAATRKQPIGSANPAVQVEAETRGKRKEKGKLGVLEMASKEFMADCESNYEEACEDIPETLRSTASTSSTGAPEPAMATGASPKPHLFLLDSDLEQEEGSEPMGCADVAVPAVPRPISEEEEEEEAAAAVVSLSQVQMTEDVRQITALIKQTKQDLVSVTKALLKTSGDFSAALALLMKPDSATGPFWGRCDDGLLLTSDPEARQQLQERYGEQGVAKRLVFLNEGL
ncbi:hypothetical protein CRUP_032932 [Coryphaenoides rupestris]|nr:hypothetical protein CRUP_032932 [Coryphaenoides rupestris]